MAANDARPVPRRATAFRVYAPIYDTDGRLITGGLTSLAANVSLDGGSVVAATATPGQVTGAGIAYLDLTASEMTADHVAVMFTVSNTNAVDAYVELYPEETGDIRVNVTQLNSDAALTLKFFVGVGTSVLGTVTGTGSATQFDSADVNDSTADLYKGRFILVTSGGYVKKATKCTAYAKVGDNGRFTVESMGASLSAGDGFIIL